MLQLLAPEMFRESLLSFSFSGGWHWICPIFVGITEVGEGVLELWGAFDVNWVLEMVDLLTRDVVPRPCEEPVGC